eukprot:scaffold49008_cov63-Phaeocystis_antarctica.AAC.1
MAQAGVRGPVRPHSQTRPPPDDGGLQAFSTLTRPPPLRRNFIAMRSGAVRTARADSGTVERFNPSGSGIDIVDAPLSGALHGLWGPRGPPEALLR